MPFEKGYTPWNKGNRKTGAEYAKTYHESHPGRVREATKRFKYRNQAKVDAIKLERGCADCGYNEHPRALQFDHVRDEKVHDVCWMVLKAFGWDRIQAEIDKCDVVCINCHATRTANRREVVIRDTPKGRWKQRTQGKVTDIKLASGCIDCEYNQHPCALEFDHVRGEKVENVSRMVLSGFAWDRIVTEIAKCEVVCANCHAIRTAERRRSASLVEETSVVMEGGGAR